MDARSKLSSIIPGEQEYELSYLMFVVPASGGSGSGASGTAEGNDVTCLIEIKPTGKPRRFWPCLN